MDSVGGGEGKIVLGNAIIVEDQLERLVRLPEDLPAKAQVSIEPGVGLPAVDEPRLDLQRIGGEPLDSQSIEEPGRVGRNEGRLVSPVVEIVVAEEADVRDENAGIDSQPVGHIEMIAGIRFRN